MLNRDSFAISVVGLTGKFLGADKRLDFNFPEIILMRIHLHSSLTVRLQIKYNK